MALASGTRVGPYGIAAQIGVGGMGEVWQRTDTDRGSFLSSRQDRGGHHVG